MEPYRIFKYPVQLADRFELELPAGAHILDVQVQQGKPVLWALLNPGGPKKTRTFRLVGTGHPISHEECAFLQHVGTFQYAEGTLVFHLFEIGQSSPSLLTQCVEVLERAAALGPLGTEGQ